MPQRKEASGGKAEATGANYETLVAAWYCIRILLGQAAQPLFDLPAATTLLSLECQTGEPVDDANCQTSDGGFVLIQAKRYVDLGAGEESSLGKTFDQFVRQYKSWVDREVGGNDRPFPDPRRDRLVLVTRRVSSKLITSVLQGLLRRVRDRESACTLSDLQTSEQERNVAEVVEFHITRCWQKHYACQPTQGEMAALLRLVWVQVLDVETGEGDAHAVLDLLRGVVLDEPPYADLAQSELVKLCARLRADRSGTDASTLFQVLERAGVKLRSLPHYPSGSPGLRRSEAGGFVDGDDEIRESLGKLAGSVDANSKLVGAVFESVVEIKRELVRPIEMISGYQVLPPSHIFRLPTSVLVADYGIIPFIDISGAKASLLQWTVGTSSEPAGRIYAAPGGSGKTRLVLEMIAELKSLGWIAGLLPRSAFDGQQSRNETDRQLERLFADRGDQGVFLAIDYAEARAVQIERLARAANLAPSGTPIRIVLLSRNAGEWWRDLLRKSASVQRMFDAVSCDVVGKVVPIEAQQAFFQSACKNFAGKLSAAQRPEEPLIVDDWAARTAVHDIQSMEFVTPLSLAIDAYLTVRGLEYSD